MTNSNQKGKRGEREFANLLSSLGFDARRAQQYNGAAGHADLHTNIPGTHWEVKRYASIRAFRFLEQAEEDCLANDLPVVAMREDRGEWAILLRAKDLPRLAMKIAAALDRSTTISDSSRSSAEDGESPAD